jgi:CRISPR-associated protein Csb2
VPDNVGDKVAASWTRGGDATIADYRTEKDVCPTHLCGDHHAVHYLWSLGDDYREAELHQTRLSAAARSITHLGWGVDMVAADASVIAEADMDRLSGELWRPVDDLAAEGLRVPTVGTLDALLARHAAFLERIGPGGFNPVPPLTAFRVVGYRRASDPPQRPFAAFSILKPDASGRRAFDTPRRAREVAGMVRHAVASLARAHGWPDTRINVFVHGKTADGEGPAKGEQSPDRFCYLPLPTINRALGRVEAIRRVLIVGPARCRQEIDWVRRALAGAVLENDAGAAAALLTILPASDGVVRQYVRDSATWSTVTPVVLPGHDDRHPAKAEKLLRTAFAQAGYDQQLLDQTALEWRRVGYWPGTDLASRYLPPENLGRRPLYHVLARFPQPIPGPVAVGSGRFRGFGLFAAMNDG